MKSCLRADSHWLFGLTLLPWPGKALRKKIIAHGFKLLEGERESCDM